MPRRQRAVSHRFREEAVHERLGSLLEADSDHAIPAYGSLGESSRLAVTGRADPRADVPELGGEFEHLQPDVSHDDDDDLSIGRFSDEGESSDSSISSNEIVDLPPPRSPGQLRSLRSTSSLGLGEGLRLRSDAPPSGSGRARNQYFGWRAEWRADPSPNVEARSRRASSGHNSDVAVRPTSPDLPARRAEDRLERGLRKQWARWTRRLWPKQRDATAGAR